MFIYKVKREAEGGATTARARRRQKYFSDRATRVKTQNRVSFCFIGKSTRTHARTSSTAYTNSPDTYTRDFSIHAIPHARQGTVPSSASATSHITVKHRNAKHEAGPAARPRTLARSHAQGAQPLIGLAQGSAADRSELILADAAAEAAPLPVHILPRLALDVPRIR